MEQNLFAYAKGNPIIQTDPNGLFSRKQIAQSLGFSSFDAVLSYFDTHGKAWGFASHGGHWGFVAALLYARELSRLTSYSVDITPPSNLTMSH